LLGEDVIRHVFVDTQKDGELLQNIAKKQRNRSKKELQAVAINGLIPGLAVHHAECCHSIPGDEIQGVVVRGKGVYIHVRECEMLCKIWQERLLNVSWKPVWETEAYYTGTLRLIIIHKTSALAALVNIIDQTDARIMNLKIKNRTAYHCDLRVDLEADDANHFDDVIASLRISSWILFVERYSNG